MADVSVWHDFNSASEAVYQDGGDAAAVRFSGEHRTVAVMSDVNRGEGAGLQVEVLERMYDAVSVVHHIRGLVLIFNFGD
jgi:hypothetical protein